MLLDDLWFFLIWRCSNTVPPSAIHSLSFSVGFMSWLTSVPIGLFTLLLRVSFGKREAPTWDWRMREEKLTFYSHFLPALTPRFWQGSICVTIITGWERGLPPWVYLLMGSGNTIYFSLPFPFPPLPFPLLPFPSFFFFFPKYLPSLASLWILHYSFLVSLTMPTLL